MIVNNFLNDYFFILLEQLQELELEIITSKTDDKEFIRGQIIAYYNSLSILKSQIEAFDLNLEELDKIDLEHFLKL